MADPHPCYDPDDTTAAECYRTALRALAAAGVEFLVGGAYALARYAGIVRHTKDLDLFLRPCDRDAALAALAAAGFRTEVTYPHWLAKAFRADYFIDLIYNSGNGAAPIDDGWFDCASLDSLISSMRPAIKHSCSQGVMTAGKLEPSVSSTGVTPG